MMHHESMALYHDEKMCKWRWLVQWLDDDEKLQMEHGEIPDEIMALQPEHAMTDILKAIAPHRRRFGC